ncbi:hypothetical protein GCM10009555_031200 [Acrocarpospora macrocephala]
MELLGAAEQSGTFVEGALVVDVRHKIPISQRVPRTTAALVDRNDSVNKEERRELGIAPCG